MTEVVIRGEMFAHPEVVAWMAAQLSALVADRDMVFIKRHEMEAGKLRHRVDLQRVAVTRDTHGDQVKTWTTLATVWASVEPISGREFLSASQVMADVTARIKIRGGIDLTPKDRVVFGSRVFDIRHVIDWGSRGVETHLMCTERY